MDFTSILKAVSPYLGAAIAGPFSGLAVEAISSVFGLTDKTTDAVKTALSGATPEQMLALKQADQAFQVQMQALGYGNVEKLAALAVENTKDARAMQVAAHSRIPGVLAIIVTTGFFSILLGMLSGYLKASENQALLILLGSLGAAWGIIINFYYGYSASAGRATELLAQAPAIKQ